MCTSQVSVRRVRDQEQVAEMRTRILRGQLDVGALKGSPTAFGIFKRAVGT